MLERVLAAAAAVVLLLAAYASWREAEAAMWVLP